MIATKTLTIKNTNIRRRTTTPSRKNEHITMGQKPDHSAEGRYKSFADMVARLYSRMARTLFDLWGQMYPRGLPRTPIFVTMRLGS